MKTIVSVLVESPLYFTLPLRDRYQLVKRLSNREAPDDLNDGQEKGDDCLRADDLSS